MLEITVGDDVLNLRMVLLMVKAVASGFLHHRVGDGVGVVLLQTGRETEHFFLGMAAEGDDLRHLGRGVGRGAGLVKDDGVRLGDIFKESSTFYGNVELGAFPHGALSTAMGMASFSAQEKSTISTESVFVMFRVMR